MVALMPKPRRTRDSTLARAAAGEGRKSHSRLPIPYLGYNSTWLQSGAGEIAGIAHEAMPLLSAMLTEQPPEAEQPTQPPPEGEQSPRDRSSGCNTPAFSGYLPGRCFVSN